jgi:hypothetical protein
MKIIALTGDSNVGKTTTLNIVYNTILNNGGISTNKQRLGGGVNDFLDIVLYNNQRIVFFTMGDYSVHLIDAIKKYDAQGLDVMICACNNRFVKPPRLIVQYPHHIVPKTVTQTDSMKPIVNNADAQTIFNLI